MGIGAQDIDYTIYISAFRSIENESIYEYPGALSGKYANSFIILDTQLRPDISAMPDIESSPPYYR